MEEVNKFEASELATSITNERQHLRYHGIYLGRQKKFTIRHIIVKLQKIQQEKIKAFREEQIFKN